MPQTIERVNNRNNNNEYYFNQDNVNEHRHDNININLRSNAIQQTININNIDSSSIIRRNEDNSIINELIENIPEEGNRVSNDETEVNNDGVATIDASTISIDWGNIITRATASWNTALCEPLIYNGSWEGNLIGGSAPVPTNNNQFIHMYNYVPKEMYMNKLNSENTEAYFGIELEIDKGGENDDNAKKILDFTGDKRIYIKHDESLTKGMEIVTYPSTYNYHVQEMNYKNLFNVITELGYKSHDTNTCGLHIHISKNFFGKNKTYQDLNISKLLFLFEKYWDKLVIFSRRKKDSLSQYAKRYEMSEEESMFDVLSKAKSEANSYYSGKYHSINLKHQDTIEFRIFRGTLRYETFIASLQLVKRMSEISIEKDLDEIQLITWEDIFKDCDDELKQYLKDKNLEV